MLVLDLYCGSKSIKGVCDALGWDYLGVDICSKYKPDICVDMLKWDYKNCGLKPDIIWCSTPCTSWSIATKKHRVLPDLKPLTETAKIGEKLVYKSIEIINYFNPRFWFIENPRGRLRHFKPMLELPFRTTVWYGNYNWHIHKPTDIWSNKELWTEKKSDKKLTKWSDIRGKDMFYLKNHIPEKLLMKLLTYNLV